MVDSWRTTSADTVAYYEIYASQEELVLSACSYTDNSCIVPVSTVEHVRLQ